MGSTLFLNVKMGSKNGVNSMKMEDGVNSMKMGSTLFLRKWGQLYFFNLKRPGF